MAMTNLNNCNHKNSNKPQALQSSDANASKQCNSSNSPNCHYTNYAATNLSHLSPIFEGEIFPSPCNTISPSLSHNNIDSNHVVLFHSNNSDSKTPKTPNHDSVSPTTSISSSNSSNTPTPTAYNTSNSLFNLPSASSHPHCIPCVGLMNASISKTSSSSSASASASASASPSPSLDTTVSPVTKMDLFRDLKIFEDIDTDEAHADQFTNNNLTIDYLTGDKHCIKKQQPQSPLNCNSSKPKVHKSKKKKKHRHRRHHQHHHHHHHSHSHSHESHHRERKKKKRRKSERNNCSDSDSELQKKGKIRDKIKTISIRVPGDPNGLYKYWKRKEAETAAAAAQSQSHLRFFAENKEAHVTQQSILDYKLKNKATNKTRDRLNSYPPQTMSLSSPSSIPPLIRTSQSCSNLLDKSIIIHAPNKENRDDNKDSKHQSFTVLGLKQYQNKRKESGCNIMSGDQLQQNRVRMNSYPPYAYMDTCNRGANNQHSLSISIERSNRKSSAAAYGIDHDSKEYHEHDSDDWHYTKHRKQKQIHQQRMAAKNNIHIGDGSINTSGAYYDNNPYLNPYYLTNYHDTKHIHYYKWKDDDQVPKVPETTDLESLSEPNPSTRMKQSSYHLSHDRDKCHKRRNHQTHSKRRRKNISDHHKDNRYNIHPSMNKLKHKMNPQSAKMTGNLVDL